MLGPELIFSRAVNPDLTIGVGAPEGDTKVLRSLAEANAAGYGHCEVYHDPQKLVEDLREGRLDAAVRGSLESNLVLRALRHEFSLDAVQRMALLQPRSGRMFLFAPVGVDEGWTVAQKVELAERGAMLLRRMGMEPRIGMLSGGRRSDRGRHRAVDRTLDDAAEAAATLRSRGFQAEDMEILIEDAARECDVIIAPDGISGNLIFRTLHFLGEGRAMGAVVLNIDRVFVDTSRAKSSYLDSIAMASALAGGR